MTKEQTEIHGEVMKWFIDHPDKGVWYQAGLSKKWFLIYHPDFSIGLDYVQNDEYSDFRKAEVDGKQIQIHTMDGWENCLLDEYIPSNCAFRIKPDEPKFKTGAWVIYDNQPEYELILWNEKSETQYKNSNCKSCYTLWRPKPGELCVFWDNGTDEYFIGRYGTEALSNTYGSNYGDAMYIKDDWGNIAPLEHLQTIKDNA